MILKQANEIKQIYFTAKEAIGIIDGSLGISTEIEQFNHAKVVLGIKNSKGYARKYLTLTSIKKLEKYIKLRFVRQLPQKEVILLMKFENRIVKLVKDTITNTFNESKIIENDDSQKIKEVYETLINKIEYLDIFPNKAQDGSTVSENTVSSQSTTGI